eukprot:1886990-Amphidinium_carterae.1
MATIYGLVLPVCSDRICGSNNVRFLHFQSSFREKPLDFYKLCDVAKQTNQRPLLGQRLQETSAVYLLTKGCAAVALNC